MSNLKKLSLAVIVATCLTLFPKPSLAAIFSAASDFATTDNLTGVWRYGWSPTLGDNFTPYNTRAKFTSTIDFWSQDNMSSSVLATVSHNSTGSIDNSHPTITFQPNQLAFHPGANGEYSIIRWIAPETENYSLAATFTGLDHVGPTTTDVHVFHNGNLLFSDLINGFGDASAKSLSTNGIVEAGDIIDFVVGYGSNQTYWYDTTGLEATISTSPIKKAPEPSTMLGIGLLAGVMTSIRRRGGAKER